MLTHGLIQNLSYYKHPVVECPAQLPSADAFGAKRISEERKDFVKSIVNDQSI